jgi:hypothetical protein
MQGVAQQWYYRLERSQGTPTWARFTELVNQCFGPPLRSNPLGELCHLHWQGSIADYTEAFLTHLSHCDTITEPHQVAIFTAGLGEPLQTDVELQRPASLEDTMGLARAYERRSTVVTPPSTPAALRSSGKPSGTTLTPTPQLTAMTIPGAPVKPRAPPGTRLSRLTPEEMARRREEGLCFNYPEKFSQDHLKQCSKKGIYLLEMDGDDFTGAIFVDDSGIEISLNALSSMSTGQTMRLGLAMHNQTLIALVDSGSTHCFMAEHMAHQLDLRLVPMAGMTVGVANGERLPCVGVCSALSFSIHGEVFCMDFFVIALDGYEVVLGCNWLCNLGPIIWNFDLLSMAFWCHDHDLLSMAFWRHDHRVKWISEVAAPCPQALALSSDSLLQLLLSEIADIFTELTGLPPPRPFDHHIHLLPSTPPVAIRPYRYPQ